MTKKDLKAEMPDHFLHQSDIGKPDSLDFMEVYCLSEWESLGLYKDFISLQILNNRSHDSEQ